MTPIEGELRKALGTNLESMMTSIQNGSGNYSVQLTPIEERKQSQQQLMQVARRTLSKYRNARISVSGGTDISGASTGGGGGRGGGGGGGGGSNRLTMIVQGPDIDELQKYANTLLDEGEGDRRRHRRRHELRSDAAGAADRHRPPAGGRSRRVDRYAVVDHEHAGRRPGSVEVQGRRRAVQRAAAARRAVPQRSGGDGRHLRARGGRPDGAGQRRRAPDARQRAGVDRSLQPDAPDLGERQPRSR